MLMAWAVTAEDAEIVMIAAKTLSAKEEPIFIAANRRNGAFTSMNNSPTGIPVA